MVHLIVGLLFVRFSHRRCLFHLLILCALHYHNMQLNIYPLTNVT